jgi:hypothetical protein
MIKIAKWKEMIIVQGVPRYSKIAYFVTRPPEIYFRIKVALLYDIQIGIVLQLRKAPEIFLSLELTLSSKNELLCFRTLTHPFLYQDSPVVTTFIMRNNFWEMSQRSCFV